MAKQKVRTATIIATLMVVAFLGILFQYLLNFDYNVQPLDSGGNQGSFLQPQLVVEEEDGGRQVIARFSLLNQTKSRMRVLNTRVFAPLFLVKMQVKNEEGRFEDCAPTTRSLAQMRQNSSQHQAEFDSESYALLDLFPGTGFSREINLGELFEFSSEGSFSVSVTYQPDQLPDGLAEQLQGMNFYDQRMSCSTVFELPIKKALPAPPPAVPQVKPAAPKKSAKPAGPAPMIEKVNLKPQAAPSEKPKE